MEGGRDGGREGERGGLVGERGGRMKGRRKGGRGGGMKGGREGRKRSVRKEGKERVREARGGNVQVGRRRGKTIDRLTARGCGLASYCCEEGKVHAEYHKASSAASIVDILKRVWNREELPDD